MGTGIGEGEGALGLRKGLGDEGGREAAGGRAAEHQRVEAGRRNRPQQVLVAAAAVLALDPERPHAPRVEAERIDQQGKAGGGVDRREQNAQDRKVADGAAVDAGPIQAESRGLGRGSGLIGTS